MCKIRYALPFEKNESLAKLLSDLIPKIMQKAKKENISLYLLFAPICVKFEVDTKDQNP